MTSQERVLTMFQMLFPDQVNQAPRFGEAFAARAGIDAQYQEMDAEAKAEFIVDHCRRFALAALSEYEEQRDAKIAITTARERVANEFAPQPETP